MNFGLFEALVEVALGRSKPFEKTTLESFGRFNEVRRKNVGS
jgi:hypothetical protein